MYGKDKSIAFYEGTKGNNFLEFTYKDEIEQGIKKIYKGLEELLIS